MKFLLVFVVTLILIIVNFGSAEKSPAYCIKKVLRPKDFYVNGVKTTKYDTKILRVCCDGYTKFRRRCVPLCEELCINSVCVAPNTCSCRRGYTKLNDHRCAPICDNCKYGFCVAPGVCVCYKGYVKDNVTGACSPVCSQPCINGYCSDLDFCTCNEGFKISRKSLFKCERNNTGISTTVETSFDSTTFKFEEDSTTFTYEEDLTTLPGVNFEFPEETATKTRLITEEEASTVHDERSLSTLTVFASTVYSVNPTERSIKSLRIPIRKSKALFQLLLESDPSTTQKSVEVKMHQTSSEFHDIGRETSSTSIKSSSQSPLPNGENRVPITHDLERTSTEDSEPVTGTVSTDIPIEVGNIEFTKFTTNLQAETEDLVISTDTPLNILLDGVNSSTPSRIKPKKIDTENSEDNNDEINDIISTYHKFMPEKEVKSSKFTIKDILLVVYCILAILALIGIYVLFWFTCSSRKFHGKEYDVDRLEKKKGIVKFSANRADIITAW